MKKTHSPISSRSGYSNLLLAIENILLLCQQYWKKEKVSGTKELNNPPTPPFAVSLEKRANETRPFTLNIKTVQNIATVWTIVALSSLLRRECTSTVSSILDLHLEDLTNRKIRIEASSSFLKSKMKSIIVKPVIDLSVELAIQKIYSSTLKRMKKTLKGNIKKQLLSTGKAKKNNAAGINRDKANDTSVMNVTAIDI
ncbi:TPR and ankyrin repeat-containing protein [Dirofilaria immitis]